MNTDLDHNHEDSNKAFLKDCDAKSETEMEAPSKSELKRRKQQIVQLADQLSSIKPDGLHALELPESILEGLALANRLKSSNARNRQLRHLANLLEGNDQLIDKISNFFEEKQARAAQLNHRHHLIEDWRDKLLETNNPHLAQFFIQYPDANRQEIRTLVRNAQKEKYQGKKNIAQRKLFKYLRDLNIQ